MSTRQQVTVDPAVAAIMQDGRRRRKARRMSTQERRQAKRDEKRHRVTLELNPEIAKMIGAIAKSEGCSPAGVVNLLVFDGVQRYIIGELEFVGHVRPSRSPRFDWVVEPSGVVALADRLIKHLKDGDT